MHRKTAPSCGLHSQGGVRRGVRASGRVTELFEARKPKDPAVLAKVSGTVYFRGKVKGNDIVVVVDDFGGEQKHTVPSGGYLLVRDGDKVKAGDPISEGSKNPHDILAILGENELQKYIMNEIQQIYRLQGVKINDKHIGVIVRQMMKDLPSFLVSYSLPSIIS